LRRVLMIMAAAGFLAAAAPAQAALVNEAPANSWQTDGKVNAIVVANGKIYIGGSFTHVRAPGAPSGGAVRNHLAALDLQTGALKPWNPGANDIVNALAVKPNGKTVYAGGHFTKVHGATRLHVAAIAADSSTLRPWKANANGKVDVIKATKSRVYIGGEFTVLKGHVRHRLAAVKAGSSAQLINWSPNASSAVFALQLSATGKRIYVGGAFDHINGKPANHLSAIKTASGSIAKKFKVHPSYTVFTLALAGKRLFVGGAGNGGHVAAYAFKTNTRKWTALTDGDVRGITLRLGVVYVGGHFNNYCQGGTGSGMPLTCNTNVGRRKFLALNQTSGNLTSWNPIGNGVQGVFAIRSNRTQVMAGGSFTQVHGVAQQGFVRFTR
jgi:trimeric autotransporter adhesin